MCSSSRARAHRAPASTHCVCRYLAALHPEVQDKLVAEMASAGVPVGGAPEAVAEALLNPETIKQLTYLQAVLNESMRMHPAGAPASNRCVLTAAARRLPRGWCLC